jgi:hypothetical protein
MASDNVTVVRRVAEALWRGDYKAAVTDLDADIE